MYSENDMISLNASKYFPYHVFCIKRLSNEYFYYVQDGRVCLFDIRNKDHVQMFDFFGQNDVSSICFVPGKCKSFAHYACISSLFNQAMDT